MRKQLLLRFQQEILGWNSEYVVYGSWLDSNIKAVKCNVLQGRNLSD